MNEIESTLVVCSNEPYEVVKRISLLESISEYSLVPQKSQNIKDSYFDRRDEVLESSKLGLRIRDVNGERLITIKGPSKRDEEGVSERLELELDWSEDGLRRILDELKSWGIETKELGREPNFDLPLQVLSNLGLEVIQRREDNRAVRNVVRKGGASTVMAELVIDSLTFNFKGQQVHHKEVEIEAKSRDGANVIGSLTRDLKNMFPSDLIMWNHGKLATGLALSGMADSGDLKVLLDEHDNLKPEAYTIINDYLLAREH